MALALILCNIFWGCHRRPLHELDSAVEVIINIGTDITNHEVKSLPGLMRVIFYDHENGTMMTQGFTGPHGGVVNVLPDRTYDVMCYNFDTQVTFIENEQRFSSAYATTNLIPEVYRKRLVSRANKSGTEEFAFDPDHLFVGRALGVHVPARSVEQDPIQIVLDAETVVQSWIVELESIKGVEYIGAISCVITGLSAGNYICQDRMDSYFRTVYFDAASLTKDGRLTARFNTFGRNPDTGEKQILSIVVSDLAGKGYVFNMDVSAQFINNPEQIIRIKTEDIEIEKPEVTEGGGIVPDVDEWDDVITDIEI